MKMPVLKTQKTSGTKFSTDVARWNAVLRADREADGKFYYSVKTTGVYCRPSCTARRPRRENVQFHVSCAEAERAGFRPCKRCQPNGLTLAEERATKVAAACRTIEAGGDLANLDALAKSAGMSRF